jgi:hypothetical protein
MKGPATVWRKVAGKFELELTVSGGPTIEMLKGP